MKYTISVHNIIELQQFAFALTTIFLRYKIRYLFCSGDYGVGKTSLIRFFVEYLESDELYEITSPSFTIYNIYPTKPPCIHIDLYNTSQTLFGILDEIEEDDSSFILVEWSNTLPSTFAEPALWCSMHYGNSLEERFIECTPLFIGDNIMKELFQEYSVTRLQSL